MRKSMLALAGGAGLLAAAAAIPVSAQGADIEARVPFSFTVRGKALPPGTYTVSNHGGVVVLRGATDAAVALSLPLGAAHEQQQAKLVFERTGDRYVLRQVWAGGGLGRQVMDEKRGQEEIRMASRSARREKVEIPLR